MRFDFAAFAMGTLSGIFAAIVMALAIDFQFARSNICLPDETFVTCFRNWFDVVAVIAGSAAAFFIVVQIKSSDRHHKEAMDLQTLELRALLSRTMKLIVEPMEAHARQLEDAELLWNEGRAESISPAAIWASADALYKLVKQSLDNIEMIDSGELSIVRTEALVAVGQALEKLHGYDLHGSPVPLSQIDAEHIGYANAASLEAQILAAKLRIACYPHLYGTHPA